MERKETANNIEIDKLTQGSLSISNTVVQKLIYNILVSEKYLLDLNDIKIINHKSKKDLEAQIKIQVMPESNLVSTKQRIIKLILKRVNSVLNINVLNINLIFGFKTVTYEQ